MLGNASSLFLNFYSLKLLSETKTSFHASWMSCFSLGVVLTFIARRQRIVKQYAYNSEIHHLSGNIQCREI